MKPVPIGRIRGWNISAGFDFLEGELDVGQEIASALIRQTRDAAAERSRESEFLVLDAPPGTACAAREAIAIADAALLVAEPTPFGLHDLRLAYKLAHQGGKKCAVVVNRLLEPYEELDRFCAESDLPVLASIPYSERLAADYSRGKLIPENYPELEAALAAVAEWLGAGIERVK
jgi:MinD superfamily P-loop ATPase